MLARVAGEATSNASQHFALSLLPRRASRKVSSSSWRVRIQSAAQSIFRPPARRFSRSLAARADTCFPMCLWSAGMQVSSGYSSL